MFKKRARDKLDCLGTSLESGDVYVDMAGYSKRQPDTQCSVNSDKDPSPVRAEEQYICMDQVAKRDIKQGSGIIRPAPAPRVINAAGQSKSNELSGKCRLDSPSKMAARRSMQRVHDQILDLNAQRCKKLEPPDDLSDGELSDDSKADQQYQLLYRDKGVNTSRELRKLRAVSRLIKCQVQGPLVEEGNEYECLDKINEETAEDACTYATMTSAKPGKNKSDKKLKLKQKKEKKSKSKGSASSSQEPPVTVMGTDHPSSGHAAKSSSHHKHFFTFGRKKHGAKSNVECSEKEEDKLCCDENPYLDMCGLEHDNPHRNEYVSMKDVKQVKVSTFDHAKDSMTLSNAKVKDAATYQRLRPLPSVPVASISKGPTQGPGPVCTKVKEEPCIDEYASCTEINRIVGERKIYSSELTREDFATYTVKQVVSCFNLCGLEDLAKFCEHEKIDGKYFVMYITDDKLAGEPWNMSAFRREKVKHVIEGFRPKLD